jgi:glucose/galactose transporter
MENNKSFSKAFYLILLLFFIFGFITWVNGVLVPYLKLACELNDWQAYLVTTAFYLPYPIMAIPSSYVLQYIGYKKGMSLGMFILALGSLVFLPAAYTRSFELFLLGLFIQGTGLSLLQTAANPYVTIVGPIESAAQRISIMGIGNKIAGILGSIILGNLILSNADELRATLQKITGADKIALLNDVALRVVHPYILLSVSLILLSVFLWWVSLPEPEMERTSVEPKNSFSSLLPYSYVWLGFFSLFLYVGAEVIAGDTIANYATEGWNIPLDTSKTFTSLTLTAMLAGYFLGVILIPKYLSQQQLLAISSIAGLLLTLGIIFLQGINSVACVALLGAANAIVWPAIWPLAIAGLKQLTPKGSALLIMGIAGGAILPLAYGWLSADEMLGKQNAYIILLPCYLFILFYATKGYRIGKQS